MHLRWQEKRLGEVVVAFLLRLSPHSEVLTIATTTLNIMNRYHGCFVSFPSGSVRAK